MFEDIDSISRSLKVQKPVLIRLKEITGSNFSNFIHQKTEELFWDSIDESLSFSESNELRKMQLECKTTSKNFDTGFLNPNLQDLFISFCEMNEKLPPILENSQPEAETNQETATKEDESDGVSVAITDDDITEYLQNSNQWKDINGMWVCNKQEFTFDSIKGMCIEFIKGGHTWEYCPVLSQTYNEAIKFIEGRNEDEDFSTVLKKMTEVKYITNADLKNDVEKVTGKKSGITLSQLRVPRALTDALRKLMQTMKKLNLENQDNEEEDQNADQKEEEHNEESLDQNQQQTSSWYKDRLQSLLDIASAPLPDKKPFEMNHSVINSRLGAIEPSFEQGSIAEMLFSTDNGVAASLPFSSSHATIPQVRKDTFIHDVVRKFVAQTLIDHNYKTTSISALELLSDYIVSHLDTISHDAAVKYKPSKTKYITPQKCVIQALLDNKYDMKKPSE